MEPLEPIKYIPDYEVKLGEAPDPYFLLEVFGAHQLERALKPRSVADLRKAAALVEARHPGTLPKPKGKAKQPDKASLIAYIVEYVTARGVSEQQAQR
jgi:hypothetical protein